MCNDKKKFLIHLMTFCNFHAFSYQLKIWMCQNSKELCVFQHNKRRKKASRILFSSQHQWSFSMPVLKAFGSNPKENFFTGIFLLSHKSFQFANITRNFFPRKEAHLKFWARHVLHWKYFWYFLSYLNALGISMSRYEKKLLKINEKQITVKCMLMKRQR